LEGITGIPAKDIIQMTDTLVTALHLAIIQANAVGQPAGQPLQLVTEVEGDPGPGTSFKHKGVGKKTLAVGSKGKEVCLTIFSILS